MRYLQYYHKAVESLKERYSQDKKAYDNRTPEEVAAANAAVAEAAAVGPSPMRQLVLIPPRPRKVERRRKNPPIQPSLQRYLHGHLLLKRRRVYRQRKMSPLRKILTLRMHLQTKKVIQARRRKRNQSWKRSQPRSLRKQLHLPSRPISRRSGPDNPYAVFFVLLLR